MKKLAFTFLGLILVVAFYYFSVGSTQLVTKMKEQLNTELISLEREGFAVKDREIKETSEYFIISLENPEKITHFFTDQGIQFNINEAKLLTGLKIAVELNYIADSYSAISLDIYPISLPTQITTQPLDEKDRKVLAQIQKMLEKKTFLIHIAINKLGTEFKGYMKDIDEILYGEKELKINMKGLKFSGDIEDNKIQRVKQNMKQFSMSVSNELEMKLTELESNYLLTGASIYDYNTDYSLKQMVITNKSQFNLHIDDFAMQSISTVKDGLASGSITTKTKNINILNEGKKLVLETFTLNIKANNLDIASFEKLQKINFNKKQNNEREVNTLIQTLISKGVSISIPSFSVAKIESEGKKMDGFNLNAHLNIDKSLNIVTLQTNPMATISAIDASLKIALSEELFAIVANQPKAMIYLMLFQPQELNGTKVYEVELHGGKLKINGVPLI